ncbi:MAG TPA: hypothetical protein VGX16_01115 [Solirubrobacteraceae bacterium]|jgi:hypothetical protein|nr:hypothetical protein [Solirubrobacteraceae bacterium]
MTTREKLMRAVLDLPERDLERALTFVESRLEDPLIRRLDSAPAEDEEIPVEEETAAAEGRADIAAGNTISHEEILRKYG